MVRKDWYYVPIQYEQAKELDRMIQKDGKKYGYKDRTELIRAILGAFIDRYERTGQCITKAKRDMEGAITTEEAKEKKEEDKNNNNNNNNDDSEHKNHNQDENYHFGLITV